MRDTGARDPQSTLATQPQPYTIITRDESRWWEMRDAAGELVRLNV